MIQRVRLTIPPLAITVAIFFGFLFLVWFVSQTVWVWVVALIALILAAAMNPLVNLVQRLAFPPHGWHIPRGLAVFLVYLLLFVTLGLGGVIVGNLLVDEIASILGGSTLPALAAELAAPGGLAEALHIPSSLVPSSTQIVVSLRQIGTALLAGIAATIPNFVTFIVRFFIVLTLGAFLVINSGRALDFWVSLFPVRRQSQVRDLSSRMGRTMGWWLLGLATQMIVIGTISGVTAGLLGLPGPALFGFAAAILELAPSLGQILMVIPAVILGATISPVTALLAAIAYTVIALIDGSLLSPMVAGRAVKLSPILVVIAIPIGLTLYGGLGAILSIPVTAAIQIFVEDVVLPWLHHLEEAPSEAAGEPGPEHEERAA